MALQPTYKLPPEFSTSLLPKRDGDPPLVGDKRSCLVERAMLLLHHAFHSKFVTKKELLEILDGVLLVPNTFESHKYLRDLKKFYDEDNGHDALDRGLAATRLRTKTVVGMYQTAQFRIAMRFNSAAELSDGVEYQIRHKRALILMYYPKGYQAKHLRVADQDFERRNGISIRNALIKSFSRRSHVREIIVESWDHTILWGSWTELAQLQTLAYVPIPSDHDREAEMQSSSRKLGTRTGPTQLSESDTRVRTGFLTQARHWLNNRLRRATNSR